MVGLGLLKLFWIVRSAGHLEEDGAGAINSAEIVGINAENFLEFFDRLVAKAHVLLRGRAGNILAGVSGGEVEARVHQTGIEFLGLLEILDSRVILRVLEGSDTLIEEVARFQFVAAGDAGAQNDERREG